MQYKILIILCIFNYSESFWKYTENNINDINIKQKNLGFNEMEIKHLEEIHNFIQNHSLGVSLSTLMVRNC